MKHTAKGRLAAIVLLVVLGVMGFAQNPDLTNPSQRKYATYGRNPMIKGGVTPEQAKARGWTPFQLPEDVYTAMYGANGEHTKPQWHKAGTWAAWDEYNRLVILACGNWTDLIRVVVEKEKIVERDKIIKIKGDTEYIPVPYRVDVPGPVEYRTEYKTDYVDRWLPVFIHGSQISYVGQMAPPTVITPVLNGIPGFSFNNSRVSANGYGAAAAAAAAAASTSSTAVTPTSGAGTSGSGGSGSSGAAGGGGGGSSGSGSR